MALFFPLFILILLAIIEFAFMFNAQLGINHASRNAALLAAEAGNLSGADCLILQGIEADILTPAKKSGLLDVEIQRTSAAGTVLATIVYVRSAPVACVLPDGSAPALPWTLSGSPAYAASKRCNQLSGCSLGMSPAQTGPDNVAVQIHYRYTWITPVGSLPLISGTPLGGPGAAGIDMVQRSIFRMEPVV